MTLEEFCKIVDESVYKPGHYLVHLRERYACEKNWSSEYNVLYCWDAETCRYYWDWDFWEGQEHIEVLGFIDTDDIKVPDYYKPTSTGEGVR